MTVENQLTELVLFISIGFAAGFIFDFYHTLLKHFRLTAWLQVLLDFLLWVLVTGICAFLLVLVNWGEIRLYVFLTLGAGLITYYLVLSPMVKKIFNLIMEKLIKIIKWIFSWVVRFFRFMFKPFMKVKQKVLRLVSRKIQQSKQKIIRIMKPARKLFNKVNHKRRIL